MKESLEESFRRWSVNIMNIQFNAVCDLLEDRKIDTVKLHHTYQQLLGLLDHLFAQIKDNKEVAIED